MKFMVTWSVASQDFPTAATRFLAGQATAASGATLLGRWHNVNVNGGWSLYETDDPTSLYKSNAAWADVMDIHTEPVIEDAAAGGILAAMFKK